MMLVESRGRQYRQYFFKKVAFLMPLSDFFSTIYFLVATLRFSYNGVKIV